MRKKVRKPQDQEKDQEDVVVVVEEKESKPEIKMSPVEEEQEPMTPLAAASPMKIETRN